MELILINASKLKIMLSAEDMTAYALDADRINYDNTETRRAFWSILDAAKHKTGFDAAADRVFIQVYPSKGGGCEMYVTKLAAGSQAAGSAVCAVGSKLNAEDIFVFDRLCDLLEFCRSALTAGYAGESSLYTDGRKYYLTLCPSCGEVPCCEYGVKLKSPLFAGYISERCSPVCASDAVPRMAVLA